MKNLDKNVDGVISEDELKAGLDSQQQIYTDIELKQILRVADLNFDGKISHKELTEFVKSIQVKPEAEEPEPIEQPEMEEKQILASLLTRKDKVDIVFNYYDADQNNAIDFDELQKALKDTYGYFTQ